MIRSKQMAFAGSESPQSVRGILGAILRRRRETASRSLVDVARAAGVSPAHLSEVERGRKEVSLDLLLAIVRSLEIPIAEFYLELGEDLGASPRGLRSWPQDPRLQLRRAAASLRPDALRTVADFTAYLAMRQSPAPRRRIGFAIQGGPPGGIR